MNEKIAIPSAILSDGAASLAANAAIACARFLGININVALCDASGTLVGFLRMPDSYLHSIDIAIDKAYTAASFRFPTARWKDLLDADPALAMGMPHRPRLVVFGGGLPINIGGKHLGGIGVSGGSADQDTQCAQAGLDAIFTLLT